MAVADRGFGGEQTALPDELVRERPVGIAARWTGQTIEKAVWT